jgi:FkbM family methyltransferase
MFQKAIQASVQLIPWRARSVVKRIPLFASLQRWMLSRFLEGKPFVHTVDAGPAKGLRALIVLPEDKGIWTGAYEQEFVGALAAAVKPDDVCFDVGGWHGFCGGVMALNGASKTVIFEPMPENCQRILKLIELNPNLAINLFQGAVGESNGQATFHVLEADSMGKLEDSIFQKDVTGAKINVPIISLDDYCQNNSIRYPKVIKVDVEGAEMMVLRGASCILRESKPTLFVEAHSRQLAADVVKLLLTYGYTTTTLETGRAPDGVTEPEVCHLLGAHHDNEG